MGDGAKSGGWRASHMQGDQKEPRALSGDIPPQELHKGGTWPTGGDGGGLPGAKPSLNKFSSVFKAR